MNRRDLLKWFGAGAIAVPVIGGMPKPEAAAIIVHQPVIDVPPPPKIVTGDAVSEIARSFMDGEVCEVSVYIRRKSAPYSIRINCNSYISRFSIHQDRPMAEITQCGDQFRKFMPLLVSTSLECTGEPEVVEGTARI